TARHGRHLEIAPATGNDTAVHSGAPAMPSPAFLPVHTLAAEIATRRLSPVDLVDEYLARIDRLEPKLQAFVSVNAANARLAAEAADKAIRSGHAVGPLHGIPIA